MITLQQSERLIRRRGVETHALEDEAVVYDLARDTVHYLNRTARLVWDRCDGTRSAGDLERELLALFGHLEGSDTDASANIAQGITRTVEMLRDDGLLETRVTP